MLKKIDHTERKKLIQSIRHILHSIEAIEDKETQNKLCEEIVNLCDQIKFNLIIDMYKSK